MLRQSFKPRRTRFDSASQVPPEPYPGRATAAVRAGLPAQIGDAGGAALDEAVPSAAGGVGEPVDAAAARGGPKGECGGAAEGGTGDDVAGVVDAEGDASHRKHGRGYQGGDAP